MSLASTDADFEFTVASIFQEFALEVNPSL